jgi:hypothetical protein
MSVDEPLPVDPTISVIEYTTIYKTQKWWHAVVLANMFGHNKIMIFLWQQKDGKWKRKHKFGINFVKDWEKMKPVIEDYIKKGNIQ